MDAILKEFHTDLLYSAGAGTRNDGFNFEDKITAFLLLKATQNMKQFWIANNMENMDDVIIFTKEGGKIIAHFFQMTYPENFRKGLTTEELTGVRICPESGLKRKIKSKLNMHRVLYTKFKVVKNRSMENNNNNILEEYRKIDEYRFYIFTNRSVVLELLEDNSPNFISINNNQLFNTDIGGAYKLNLLPFSKLNQTNDSEFCKFLKSTVVYANQGNIKSIELNIMKLLSEIVPVFAEFDAKTAADNYMTLVYNWIEIRTRKIGMTPSLVRRLVEYSILKSFSHDNVSVSQGASNEMRGGFFWEDIKSKNLSLTESDLLFAKMMFSNDLERFDVTQLGHIANILFHYTNYKSNDVSYNQKYLLACFMGEAPFLLKHKLVNLHEFNRLKYKPIEDNNIKNLSKISRDTFLELLKEDVTFSCGRKIALNEIIDDSQETFNRFSSNLSISDVLTAINSKNGDADIKTDKIFLDRKIKTGIFLKVGVLNETNLNLFVINIFNLDKDKAISLLNINCNDACTINGYGNKFKYVLVTDLKEFGNFTQLHSTSHKNIHFVEMVKSNSSIIKWVDTWGTIESLLKFRTDSSAEFNDYFSSEFSHENEFIDLMKIHSCFWESVLIISDVPGAGKSTAMRQIALSTPENVLVLSVDLKREEDYFQELKKNWSYLNDAKKFLNYFHANRSESTFSREIFNIKLERKEVLVLFDGFDEIAPTFTEVVIKIIKCIQSGGYKIILTTRAVMQERIEKEFCTFSVSLSRFTDKQQLEYIENFLAANKKYVSYDDLTNMIIKIKYDMTLYSDFDSFCSLPLHTNLIANYLLKNFDKVKIDEIDFLDLYEDFVNNKIDIYTDKIKNKVIDDEDIEKYHKLFAVKMLSKHTESYKSIEKNLELYLQAVTDKLKTGGEKVGFLIFGELFVHRTFAEFYVAKWLWDIISTPDYKDVFNGETKFAQSFFKEMNLLNFFPVIVFFKLFIKKQINLYNLTQCTNWDLDSDSDSVTFNENYDKKMQEIKINKQTSTISNKIACNCSDHSALYAQIIDVIKVFINCNEWFKLYPDFVYVNKDIFDWVIIKFKFNLCKYLFNSNCDTGKCMHSANYFEDIEIIKYLLSFESTRFQDDKISYRPFKLPLENERVDALKFLIRNGRCKDLKSTDSVAATYFHYVAAFGGLNGIQYLRSHFTDIDIKNKNDQTPLHYAAKYGNFDTFKFLIANGADHSCKDYKNSTTLHFIAAGGNLKLMKYFIALCADDKNVRNMSGVTPLHMAIQHMHLELIIFLIGEGFDHQKVDLFGNTCLHFAAATGNVDLIKYLIRFFNNINVRNNLGQIPFNLTIESGNSDAFRYLIHKGTDVNNVDLNGDTLLHYAARSEDFRMISYIIEEGGDINVKNKLQQTPLHLAIKFEKRMTALLKKGADLNTTDLDGYTILHYAAKSGNLYIIRKIIEDDGNINIKNKLQQILLNLAIKFEKPRAVKFLLKNGAKPNTIDLN